MRTMFHDIICHNDIVQVVVIRSLLGRQQMVRFNPDIDDTLLVNNVSPMATPFATKPKRLINFFTFYFFQ